MPRRGRISKARWKMVHIVDGHVEAIVTTGDDPDQTPILSGHDQENPPLGFQAGMPLWEYAASEPGRNYVFEPMNDEAESKAVAPTDIAEAIRATGDAIARVVEAHGQISKIDEDKRLVFGWAYVSHDKDGNVSIDKSGDFVDDYEELEKGAYNFVIKSRAGDSDHSNEKTSDMVESMVFTPDKIEKMGLPAGIMPTGWWVGFKVEDEELWQSVKKGKHLAFSVHGSGVRKQVE